MDKLEHHTLVQRIYHRVRALIESGVIQSGERLDERALAERMDVSRTPLREAVGKLAEEGLVEHRPYKGNFVRTFTAKQVSDIYEVRKMLEGLAVRLAVPKLTDEDVTEVRAILDDIATALDHGDIAEYSAADQRFHDAMARLAGNEALREALGRLRGQVQIIRIIANRDPDVVDRTARERPRIVAVLEARDAEAAASLMEAHIEGVRGAVVAQFEALQERELARVAG